MAAAKVTGGLPFELWKFAQLSNQQVFPSDNGQ
jgi:hypothetical protein